MKYFTKVGQEQGSQGLCICGREGSGDWIGCDSGSCPVQWYHWECVGITKEPVGDWVCPRCSAGASKVPPKVRKPRRTARIVYETTEASIFDHIIAESRAAALAIKEEAKAQELAGRSDQEEHKPDLEDESTERTLVRKRRAEVDRELEDAEDQQMNGSPYDQTTAPGDIDDDGDAIMAIEEPEDHAALSTEEAASRLIFLGTQEPSTAVHETREGDGDAGHKVNFFDLFPPSREVAGMYETSAMRSTLPRLDG